MKYYTDGYTRISNPSEYGGGFTVIDDNNKLILTESVSKKGFTNNEAELLGIEACLKACEIGDEISTDSMCMISWVKKGKSKARKDLSPIMLNCKNLLAEKKVNLIWEPREYNLAGIYNDEEGLDTGRPLF